MGNEKTISACRVTVDFTHIVRHPECTAGSLREMARRAQEEVGRSTIAEVARSLLKAIAEVLEEWADRRHTMGRVASVVQMNFDRLASLLTVQAYVHHLDLFLNKLFRENFSYDVEPVKVEFQCIHDSQAICAGFN